MNAESTPECRALLRTISAYLDGDLDSAACETIEQHCARCPPCAEVVEGLRKTIGLCREAAATPLPEAIRARARASIQRLLESPPGRWKPS